MDASGNGQISDALMCFNWLASKGVQVISCSWGTTNPTAGLQQALSRLSMAGILISTSAGNNGLSTDTSPQFPSAYSSTLSALVSVAATDASGALWTRSNYGNMTVQLAAPGVNIIGLGTDSTTIQLTGSSMVCPSPPLQTKNGREFFSVLLYMDKMDDFVAPFVSKLRRASTNVELLKQVHDYRWLSTATRITLTVVVVAWGIFLSQKYVKAKNKEDINSWKDVNQLWLGKDVNGLLIFIFRVWVYTIIFSAVIGIVQRFQKV